MLDSGQLWNANKVEGVSVRVLSNHSTLMSFLLLRIKNIFWSDNDSDNDPACLLNKCIVLNDNVAVEQQQFISFHPFNSR